MYTILFVIGTRPEVIKVAPVVLEMRKKHNKFKPLVLATAQHRDLLDQMMAVFGLTADLDLNIMKSSQSLTYVTQQVLGGVGEYLEQMKPDLLLIQGDTTTTFAAALAAFYKQIPVAHLEAGLRTYQRYAPYPEEINRCMTTRLASLHLAPSQMAADNLLREGIEERSIVITGNTVIDALDQMIDDKFILDADLEAKIEGKRVILVTTHRRGNFGPRMGRALSAIAELVEQIPDTCVVFPVHPNPAVRASAKEVLGDKPRIHLIDPIEYKAFCNLMARSTLLLTDSGGLQEEGPHLGKPVLVLRDFTERPEAVAAGSVKLVGCDYDTILSEGKRLLTNKAAYEEMAQPRHPYGNGDASEKVVEALGRLLDGAGDVAPGSTN
jgi:UDP-N-acetylglucosamine 2-epimerase (non-hydrolysing)